MEFTVENITSIITALGVSFVALQAYYAKIAIENENNREKKQMGITMLNKWSSIVDINTSRYLKFAFSLSSDDIKKIRLMEKLIIDNKIIQLYLPEIIIDANAEKTEIPYKKVAEIKFTIIKVTNILEEIALSYKYDVADKKIIEETFHDFLVNKDNGILSGCIK